MKKFSLISVLLLAAASQAMAKVTLPPIFSDNMVIQQQTEAAVWGWTKPGRKVVITPSWSGKGTSVVAGKDGKFLTRISTPAAGGPYTISFNDGENVTISNVLAGEVWLASGQSNMEMKLGGNAAQPVEGTDALLLKANPETPIRIFKVGRQPALKPMETFKGKWGLNTAEDIFSSSAIAYMFAKEIQETVGVPVGILETDWGGSNIEAWMNPELLRKEFPDVSLEAIDSGVLPENGRVQRKCPGVIYCGQLYPVMPYTFKGMLWYQGESNRSNPAQYVELQKAFVKMLRDEFQNPDAPFYFVQIAPYAYDGKDKFASGYFYEAQEKAWKETPGCGMVTTGDVGEERLIHPRRKAQVAHRLACYALTRQYGRKVVTPEPPTYKSVEFDGGKAKVSLNCDRFGVNPSGPEVGGFEISGADKVFHRAKAKVIESGKKILVWNKDVKEPVAVRYCFRNWSVATVFNQWGQPLAPFRTDNWDEL